ncbi:amino acid/amide ABC transporter membrane protein 2 (HAAT family) /amino acid/amide ABC transporter ATP-binding protein 1 (HAAT family) [Tepidamorphus gemmatus]|uniref:Amino acid/amide ABC transporter membrane protein 2 (HAAT family) /amino acid/amide ABC transporter ATP-binding protein 1 (HAAT family) n=2 Tax=Tepidamorphus gemmatus TaxID=747076 RepID=A0A4R3LT45_9HYPH|nr:ATP-binding cassette domain-containing protein [Tepidamorphus gemmatus]TCT03026.1 amino acid/amide ABC transporter membrane protein 2 (HAAT family) /amino acid/amide ABC transporter ATP-binding protein 1 (HAAT family) [Tepidamorphus gemmatus]
MVDRPAEEGIARERTGFRFSRVHRSAILGGVVALIAVAAGPFVLDTYMINILIRALLLAALVMTVDILWGYTGILTFGQSAFFGIGAYACGLVFTHYGFGPGWALGALAIGVLVAVVVAVLVGWLAFFHGASPLYASIVTLALPIVVTQLIFSGGRFTGSSSGLSGFPTYYWDLEIWFWLAGGFLVIVAVFGWMFVRSDMGRVLVAIRENEDRCAYLGVPVSRIKIGLMAGAAAIGAVAGFGYAAFTNVVAPELAGFLLGTELLIWTALGGRGTLIGPILGAIGIDVMSSYLSGSLPFLWKLMVGIAFVVVIVALPQGLAPLIGGLVRRMTGSRAEAPLPLSIVPTPPRAAGTGVGSDAAPIRINDLVRRYGSLSVLNGVSFEGRRGEILGIVGPNGAGKTTLMRCVSDGGERTRGQVAINGVDIGRGAPQTVAALGVGRSFQNTSLFDSLTVGECLQLARYRIDGARMLDRSDEVHLPEPARDILKATGLDQRLGEETRHLSHGMKRGLELAMVLATEPSVLLLDEPTAGLTKAERTAIGDVLTRLARDFNLCILLIEHDLDFVRGISGRIVVLHQGALLMEGTVDEVVNSDLVRAVYSGESAGHVA